MPSDHKLAFDTPARTWTEALPLGNGRLGAMIYGGLESEEIALNEDSFWSGYKDSWQTHPIYEGRMATPDPQNWRDAADLALQGQLAEAEALLQAKHTGPYTQGYLPVGDLRLTLDHRGADPTQATDYRRELDFGRGVHTVSYRIDGHAYRREAYLSEPDQVLVLVQESASRSRRQLRALLNPQRLLR